MNELIFVWPADQGIFTVAADQEISTGITIELVIAVLAEEHVVSVSANHQVIATVHCIVMGDNVLQNVLDLVVNGTEFPPGHIWSRGHLWLLQHHAVTEHKVIICTAVHVIVTNDPHVCRFVSRILVVVPVVPSIVVTMSPTMIIIPEAMAARPIT